MSGGGRLWRHADHLSALDTGPMLNFRGPKAVTTVRPPRTDAPQSGHSKPAVRRDERAVSKVVGVVLLIAIVIALAAVVAGMVSGFSGQLQEPAPQLYTEFEYDDDVGDAAEEYGLDVEGVNEEDIDEVVTLGHGGGDGADTSKLYLYMEYTDGSGDTVILKSTWDEAREDADNVASAGDEFYFYTWGDATLADGNVQIVWRDDSGVDTILAEWDGPQG